MSGPYDERPGRPSEPWPSEDFAGQLDPWGEGPWDVKRDGDRRRPTGAEQAVPWLIGLVLALTGMVIVMAVLIFSTEGEVAASPSPSAEPTLTPQPTPTGEPTATPVPTPTPEPTPEYGALELYYQARVGGNPTVMNHDFSTTASPEPAFTDSRGVDRFDWSPDGQWGVALTDGALTIIEADGTQPNLVTGIDGVAISADSTIAWAIRVTHATSTTDKAELIRVIRADGSVAPVASWTYPTPSTFQESAAKEAAFDDDGGHDRVMELDDGRIVAWILGAPDIYTFDPETAESGTIETYPTLWAPSLRFRVEVVTSSGSTNLVLRDTSGNQSATVSFAGLVSHLRWSPNSLQVVFTVTPASGSVRQDLYVWDLTDGKQPSRLTQDGVSRGAVWRGAPVLWLP